jgi:hypothetical protein
MDVRGDEYPRLVSRNTGAEPHVEHGCALPARILLPAASPAETPLLVLHFALELGDLLVELGAALLELVLGLDDLVLVRLLLLVARDHGRRHILSSR